MESRGWDGFGAGGGKRRGEVGVGWSGAGLGGDGLEDGN